MSQATAFILRAFRITLLNIRTNKEICLVSVVTIAIAFSILGVFLLIFVNLNSLLATWNQQVQLVVYLQDNISKKERDALDKLIRENPEVEAAEFTSKETAWSKFKGTFSGKTDIIESLEFNPLPASISLQFKPSPKRLEAIRQFAETFKAQKGVESLEYGEKWIERFEAFMVFLRMFLLAVGGLLSFGLILIISNTIKLSIYSRKEEIELMLLVGARPRFVKTPFLLEGIFQAALGALISLLVIKGIHLYMTVEFGGKMSFILRGMNVQFVSKSFILAFMAVSMLIGWLGSFISMNRFMDSEVRK